MLPWVHSYVEPSGKVLPCCNTDSSRPLGSVKNNSLKNIVMYSDKYKDLRRNMLNGVKSPNCEFCYKTQETSPWSFRSYANENFGHNFDQVIADTNEDGSLKDFNMRYYDIRFSNICNFKCRTCGPGFSSSWASENTVFGGELANKKNIIKHADDHRGMLLNEVFEHIPNIELAYFAGGEPLITEEHYLILEELIRQKRTDILLRYNTNLSNLKFKDYDLISLWKQFKKIEISASIDHYGEKAEYIRNGTDWGVVESNLNLVRTFDFIDYQFNTVLSVFNYATLSDFYLYMKERGLYRQTDRISLTPCLDPKYFSSQSMPTEIKKVGTDKLQDLIKILEKEQYYSVQSIINAINFTNNTNTWEENKRDFHFIVNQRDGLRNEDFKKTFPELSSMMD